MQGQGTLVSLAQSRLKLLEAICLPSIREQTILNHTTLSDIYNSTKWGTEVTELKNRTIDIEKSHASEDTTRSFPRTVDPVFLWIIKVDPNLDPNVLNELKIVLEPVKQFTLVVGSLINYGIGINPGGWRDGKAGQDILDAFQDGRVYFPEDDPEGNGINEINYDTAYQLIRRAHEARSDRVVLETRLDADDAINVRYFSALHYTALGKLVNRNVSGFVGIFDDGDDDQSGNEENDGASDGEISVDSPNEIETARWMYWCPHRHVQWSPSSEFYNPNKDPGMLYVFESPNLVLRWELKNRMFHDTNTLKYTGKSQYITTMRAKKAIHIGMVTNMIVDCIHLQNVASLLKNPLSLPFDPVP